MTIYIENAMSLETAIEKLAANCSPTIEQPSIFISWAEIVCDVLCTLYQCSDYEDVTEMLYEACKEHQGYVSEDAED